MTMLSDILRQINQLSRENDGHNNTIINKNSTPEEKANAYISKAENNRIIKSLNLVKSQITKIENEKDVLGRVEFKKSKGNRNIKEIRSKESDNNIELNKDFYSKIYKRDAKSIDDFAHTLISKVKALKDEKRSAYDKILQDSINEKNLKSDIRAQNVQQKNIDNLIKKINDITDMRVNKTFEAGLTSEKDIRTYRSKQKENIQKQISKALLSANPEYELVGLKDKLQLRLSGNIDDVRMKKIGDKQQALQEKINQAKQKEQEKRDVQYIKVTEKLTKEITKLTNKNVDKAWKEGLSGESDLSKLRRNEHDVTRNRIKNALGSNNPLEELKKIRDDLSINLDSTNDYLANQKQQALQEKINQAKQKEQEKINQKDLKSIDIQIKKIEMMNEKLIARKELDNINKVSKKMFMTKDEMIREVMVDSDSRRGDIRGKVENIRKSGATSDDMLKELKRIEDSLNQSLKYDEISLKLKQKGIRDKRETLMEKLFSNKMLPKSMRDRFGSGEKSSGNGGGGFGLDFGSIASLGALLGMVMGGDLTSAVVGAVGVAGAVQLVKSLVGVIFDASKSIIKTFGKTLLDVTKSFGGTLLDFAVKPLLKSIGSFTLGIFKNIGKLFSKGVMKSILKKIPIVGALLGAGFAIDRLMDGDVKGAGLEMASGLASTVPGYGTAVSAAIDTGLVVRDATKVEKNPDYLQQKKVDNIDAINRAINNNVSNIVNSSNSNQLSNNVSNNYNITTINGIDPNYGSSLRNYNSGF